MEPIDQALDFSILLVQANGGKKRVVHGNNLHNLMEIL